MSRHRVKAVSYDEDDFDDDYDSPDPEEEEFLEQCTAEVLNQLRAGDPPVNATRDEVQEALWHYYNDVEKSVNYLRGALSLLFGRGDLDCIPAELRPAFLDANKNHRMQVKRRRRSRRNRLRLRLRLSRQKQAQVSASARPYYGGWAWIACKSAYTYCRSGFHKL